jgi:HK97 family phage portal protein
MALADRVASRAAQRQISRAADPVTMEEFGVLLSGQQGTINHSGVSVTARRAMSIPAWKRGTQYLAEQVSGLPTHTYRDRPGGRERRADPLWLKRPDTETPWLTLVEHWVMSMTHRGDAFAFKKRNPAGQVVGLRGVHPDRVKKGLASDGTKVFQLDGNEDVGFTTREILHIPGLSLDGVWGIDVITYMAQSIGTAAAAEQFAASSFGQGNHLQAYLSFKEALTPEQADRTKAQWEKFHKGMANANEFGVLGNGAEYHTVSLTPEQQQLLETRGFEVTEMARIIGVPPHKLYDLARATFSNIEHQAIEAVTDSIMPWVRRIEAYVNFDPHLLPPGNFIEMDPAGLLRGDAKSEAESLTAAIDGGWMTPQYAARVKNFPAPDTLNYYRRPLNFVVIDPVDGEVPADPPPPGGTA